MGLGNQEIQKKNSVWTNKHVSIKSKEMLAKILFCVVVKAQTVCNKDKGHLEAVEMSI